MKTNRYAIFPFARRATRRWAAALLLGLAVSGTGAAAQADDEAAIAAVAQALQQGWNGKSGAAFAAPFAAEHDYVAITGLFRPNATREGNAAAHQQLFDGVFRWVDLDMHVAKVRFLSPAIAVAHLRGRTYPTGDAAQTRQAFVITAVLHKPAQTWEIVAFQNTPVQPPPPASGKP